MRKCSHTGTVASFLSIYGCKKLNAQKSRVPSISVWQQRECYVFNYLHAGYIFLDYFQNALVLQNHQNFQQLGPNQDRRFVGRCPHFAPAWCVDYMRSVPVSGRSATAIKDQTRILRGSKF